MQDIKTVSVNEVTSSTTVLPEAEKEHWLYVLHPN